MYSKHGSATTVQTDRPVKAHDGSRLDFIDGLRGLAIAMVVLRHYYLGVYTPSLPRITDVMSLGYLGVSLFLILSGFCVTWAYVGQNAREFRWQEFAIRRATRILPAYYAALALFIIVSLPMPWSEFIWQSVTHLTMTHNFFYSTVLALKGPFWSLALESQLYVIFPLLFLGYKRFGILKVLLFIFVIQMTFRGFVASYIGTEYNELTFVWQYSLAGRVLEFTLGVLAAVLIRQQVLAPRFKLLTKALPAFAFLSLAAAYIAKHTSGATAPLTDLLWALGFFAMLLGASLHGSLLNRILSWRPLVQLGVISYSVYLLHQLFLIPLTDYVRQTISQPWLVLTLMLPVIAVTITLCYGFYLLVEKPSQRYFSKKRRPKAVVQPSAVDLSTA